MKKVVRYQCEWCGGEFKTPDRHICKWAPESHNCLSCVHRGKFVEGRKGQVHPFTGECLEDPIPNAFECAACPGCCGEGGWNDFHPDWGATSINRDKHCSNWKLIDGYKGKQTFKEIEEKRR